MANKRILIVEDEEGVASLIHRYLERAGYAVAARAATGEDALGLAERLQPDLTLMDISLSGTLDGVQTAILLRQRFGIPVVFLTGRSDDDTLRRSQEAKAFGYVVKPFRQDDLKSSIDLALNKSEVEGRLRQVERWFAAAIRSIGEGVITTDAESRVTFLNPVAEALTGWTLELALGRTLTDVFQLVPVETGPSCDPSETVSPPPTYLLARDRTQLPVECNASPIRDEAGARIGRVLVFRDVTARQRAEEELRRSREHLRALAAHAEQVREGERIRIAREVHDELGQMVTGLRMDLAWMEKRLSAIADEPLRLALETKERTMFELLDRMVRAVRKISGELRPVVLDDLGLVPALEWQAREWQARTGIVCQVSSPAGHVHTATDRSTALFRIFQEGLTNVARHAQATEVQAQLGLSDGWLTLEIRDNGRGITEEQRHQTKSFGLLGMQERATLLGGTCRIHGAPGGGTTVEVRIPLHSP